MALELEALRGRVADAEALRADNAVLRAAADQCDSLSSRISELEAELQIARASAFAAAPAPAARPPAPPRLRAVPETSTEQSLQQVIDRVARLPGVRAVALADDLGLLVAGAGDHGTALAAYGGFLAGVGVRAREHLPLGGLRRCAIEDENATTICVSPLRGAPLMLVTMSSGTGPNQQQVARLLEDAARVVA
jgi:predicted regulator of Ras-like GTPase activity (Roadblock/LC7/MglB family)